MLDTNLFGSSEFAVKPSTYNYKKHFLDDDRAKLDMRVNEMPYDTAAIRKLLMAVFDDQDLTIFCFDYFRPVYDNFASEMGHLLKIQLLIDHCEKHNKFDHLLTLVKQTNPVQYHQFIPVIRKPPRTLQMGDYRAKSQVEVEFRGDFSSFTPELREVAIAAAVGALAGVLNIPRDQISVLQGRSGSITLWIEMPTEAVNRLIALDKTEDPMIQVTIVEYDNKIQGFNE